MTVVFFGVSVRLSRAAHGAGCVANAHHSRTERFEVFHELVESSELFLARRGVVSTVEEYNGLLATHTCHGNTLLEGDVGAGVLAC